MIISYTFVAHKCHISNYHEKQAHIYTIYIAADKCIAPISEKT